MQAVAGFSGQVNPQPPPVNERAGRLGPVAGERVSIECRGPEGVYELEADAVFGCTYSALNELLEASGEETIPLNRG